MSKPLQAMSRPPADRLLRGLVHDGSRSLVDVLRDAIVHGRTTQGERLPTIREIARRLGVSSGSVAGAWAQLRAEGLISTHRRGGTVVGHPSDEAPGSPPTGWLAVDLANGLADPALQPSVADALAAGARNPTLNDPHYEPITAALARAVRTDWPFDAAGFATAGGGSEGIMLAIEAAAPPGSVVAIEQPTSPRLIEMIELLQLRAVPVACDDDGPVPEALAEALRHSPRAFIYQPRAHIPLGHTVGAQRLKALADVLAKGIQGPQAVQAPQEAQDSAPWIVEDDNTGPIAQCEAVSIGRFLPQRTVHMRAYCRTFGLDLRTSIVAGPQPLIDRVIALRSRRFGMTSRILQDALAHLLSNTERRRDVRHARERYAWRRRTLIAALARHGLHASNADGLIVWLGVADEQAALLALAAVGIAAGAGSRCFLTPQPRGHIRIAASRLPDDVRQIEHLSELVAQALEGRARNDFD